MKNQPPIVLVGGGTGGHIMPLIAVAEELTKQKIPFLIVGEIDGREEGMIKALNWPFQGIYAGKWRRYITPSSLAQNLFGLLRLAIGFFQAFAILVRTKSPMVFSKGGGVALPVLLAAVCLGRRIVLHESDSVLSLTARLTQRWANLVLTAFPLTVFGGDTRRFHQVGVPVRRSLRQAADLPAPRKSRPLIFIIGGIQGSRFLNSLVFEALPQLLPKADIVHVVGESNLKAAEQYRQQLSNADQKHYQPFVFVDRKLAYYLQAADVIITRASATVLTEIALFGRAALVVPLPTAAENHQLSNAHYLASVGAIVIAEESKLTTNKLVEEVTGLLHNTKQRQQLGQKLHQEFYRPTAAAEIVQYLTNGHKKEK